MLNGIGDNLERYLTLLSARQKLVASNIANVDTPGYKTKDINFQTEFQSVLSEQSAPRVIELNGLVTKSDGNNVSMEREARLLAENGMRFQIASQLLRSEIRSVRTAIQEGKSS